MRTDIAHAGRYELSPPENESPHQDLAELGICLHESEHLLAVKFDGLHQAW